MKVSNQFKEVIKAHLDKKASADDLFAAKYASESKSIDDCITYILNTVEESGCNGFMDDEVFGMAVHYYDEASIDIGKAIDTQRVVVNHVVELTEADKIQAHADAMTEFKNMALAAMQKKIKGSKDKKAPEKVNSSVVANKPVIEQASMF